MVFVTASLVVLPAVLCKHFVVNRFELVRGSVQRIGLLWVKHSVRTLRKCLSRHCFQLANTFRILDGGISAPRGNTLEKHRKCGSRKQLADGAVGETAFHRGTYSCSLLCRPKFQVTQVPSGCQNGSGQGPSPTEQGSSSTLLCPTRSLTAPHSSP